MSNKFDDLMYQAGLTAQGCWDQMDDYDRTAILKFAELIVLECANAVMDGTKEGDHYAMRIENHFDSGTDGILHFGVE